MSGDTDVRSRLADVLVIGSEALLTALGCASAAGVVLLVTLSI
jgi:hypothetical protein